MAALPKHDNHDARVPDDTIYKIRETDKAVAHVKAAHTTGHARARVHQVYRLGVELKQQSDLLIQKLEKGESWLQKNEGHPKFQEREDQWFCWLAEYEAIQDALQRASEVDR